METKIERFKRTTPPRCIRTYQRVAYKDHTCWRCPHPISAGDEYRGEIVVGKVTGRKYISVWKEHRICPGDRYEDESDKEWKRIQKEDAITSEKAIKAA